MSKSKQLIMVKIIFNQLTIESDDIYAHITDEYIKTQLFSISNVDLNFERNVEVTKRESKSLVNLNIAPILIKVGFMDIKKFIYVYNRIMSIIAENEEIIKDFKDFQNKVTISQAEKEQKVYL
jgi:hypothetical protein